RTGGIERARLEPPAFAIALGPDNGGLPVGRGNAGHENIGGFLGDGHTFAPLTAGVFAEEHLIVLVLVSLPGEPESIAVGCERGVIVLEIAAGDLLDERSAIDLDSSAERVDAFSLWHVQWTERELALGDL